MSKIRIRNGPYTNREVTLTEGAVTIGRDAEAGLPILDRSASRFHAEVVPVGGMYFVRDLDSKNGTYINDDKLEDEELLREGDVIKIGTTELVFESGIALTDSDSGQQISYEDDDLRLTNTIAFRVDDLSDIEDDDDQPDDGHSLRILYQVGKILNSSNSADPCSKMLDLLISALPADHAIVLIRHGNTSKLTPKYIRAAEQWSKPIIARSIIKRVITENRAVLTENAQEDGRFNRRNSVVDGNVRSVICVPLSIKGFIRGVVYFSRSRGSEPFSHADLELLSACSIQLGMHFSNQEQIAKQHNMLWHTINSMVHIMELSHKCVGRGNRCARVASAIGTYLQISDRSQRIMKLAASLHHIGALSQPCGKLTDDGDYNHTSDVVLTLLNNIPSFKLVTPLIANAHERLDGSGPLALTDDQLDLETRIVAVAVAFEEATSGNYDVDMMAMIDALEQNVGLDTDVVTALRSAHLNGSLYQSGVTPLKQESLESEEI